MDLNFKIAFITYVELGKENKKNIDYLSTEANVFVNNVPKGNIRHAVIDLQCDWLS